MIERFEIIGLFGYKNISITFNDPIMIVIGENGFGKTSILNALTFTLQGDYKQLQKISFESITITINKQTFSFNHKLVEDYIDYLERTREREGRDMTDFVKENIGERRYAMLCDMVSEGRKKDYYNIVNNSQFLKTIPSNILYNAIFSRLEREKFFSVFDDVRTMVNSLECDVLYLPTYRRVEVGLDSLGVSHRRRSFLSEDERFTSELNNAIIRFGMEDVQKRIDVITTYISQSFITGYAEASGDMIRRLLAKNEDATHKLTCDRKQMQIVLARIGNSLTEDEKNTILDMVESKDANLLNNPYLVYFLEQLLAVYKKQEKYDSAIKKFCEVCNKYLHEKEFYFDESNVTLKIYRKLDEKMIIDNAHEVKLNQLSSGEKQIVSIFSQIYLDVGKKYIVLLDEPELSLSIFWQENLIPDLIDSGCCSFIMAVTHSPFIFGQKLKQYTIGISEFMSYGRND